MFNRGTYGKVERNGFLWWPYVGDFEDCVIARQSFQNFREHITKIQNFIPGEPRNTERTVFAVVLFLNKTLKFVQIFC